MMDGESGEFMLAYYDYIEHGTSPSVFSEYPLREKAIIAAFIETKIEAEEKEKKRMNSKVRRGRRS